jgi:hypothetical protein
MKILVAGSEGSIGQRYCAILGFLGHEVVRYDVVNSLRIPAGCDGAIVATPDFLHIDTMLDLMNAGITKFLCEKPIDRDPSAIQGLKHLKADIHCVCNWKYIQGMHEAGQNEISYDYYNSGKEDMRWNLCQPIYLADKFTVSNKSPLWTVKVNGRDVSYREMENSYITMLEIWIQNLPTEGGYGLWTLYDAIKMTEKASQWQNTL